MSNCIKYSRRSWVVAMSTFLLMLLETGAVKSLGVLLPSIREQFDTKTWEVGFAIALVPGFGTVMCFLSGAITKVLSARTTITLCGLIAAFGLMCASMATNVYVLMVSLVLTGFSTGTTPVAIGTLSKYFDRHYNVAVTAASCGMSMGIIAMPPFTQMFLDTYGWRGATLLLSGFSLNAVICGLAFKSPNGERPHGYYLLGQSIKTEIDKRSVWYNHMMAMFDINLFKNLYFVGLVAMALGNGYSVTGWIIYVMPHALDAGFTPYRAATIATVGGIGTLVGNCMFPMLNQILPNKRMLYIFTLLMSIAVIIDSIVTSMFSSYVGMTICSTLYGLVKGVMSPTWYAELNDVINDDTQITGAMGLAYTAYGVGSLLSGFTSGLLYDVYGNYTVTFLVLGVVPAMTLIPLCITDSIKLSKAEPKKQDG